MTAPLQTAFVAAEPGKIADTRGRIVVFADGADTALDPLAPPRRPAEHAARWRASSRATPSPAPRPAAAISSPSRPASRPRRCRSSSCRASPPPAEARLAGAAIAGFNGSVPLTVLARRPGARRRGRPGARAPRLRLPTTAPQGRCAEAPVPNAVATFEVRRTPPPPRRPSRRSPRRRRASSSPAISSASRRTS